MNLNLIQILFLWVGGMPLFDSICHAFSTIATAGFSPKNFSIGYYGSAYFEWVTIIFMFIGGMGFMLFYLMLKNINQIN